jgi:hypothetical protein
VDTKNLAFRKAFSGELDVLVESQREDGLYSGFDQHFNKVILKSDEDLNGNWLTCKEFNVMDEYNYVQI